MMFSNASLSCKSLDGNRIKHNLFLIAILFCYSPYTFSWFPSLLYLMVVDLNCPSAGRNDALTGSNKEVFDLLIVNFVHDSVLLSLLSLK